MYAQRALIETDADGRPVALPRLPPNTRLEAIFLAIEAEIPAPLHRRSPPAILRGSVEFLDDAMTPAAPADDRDALR